MYDIILEGNALQIINEMNSAGSTLSRFGHFIDDIKINLCSFKFFRVIHDSRAARAAVTYVMNSIWLEEIPPSIYGVVKKMSLFLDLKFFNNINKN
jgi:hypothetical protein